MVQNSELSVRVYTSKAGVEAVKLSQPWSKTAVVGMIGLSGMKVTEMFLNDDLPVVGSIRYATRESACVGSQSLSKAQPPPESDSYPVGTPEEFVGAVRLIRDGT
jgi:hypothetical protein